MKQENQPPALLVDGPATAAVTFIFAHGAGSPMDAPFMETVAKELGKAGLRVVRFEFPYMAGRRTGTRKGPDRPAELKRSWLDTISTVRAEGAGKIAIGGKSMGGRIASMVADEAGVDALVCMGYPFHPPGQPGNLRTAHLADLKTRTLILQGTRDTFGTPEDVAGYVLSPSIRIVWIEDGDHSFKPRKSSGRIEKQNLETAIETAGDFLLKN